MRNWQSFIDDKPGVVYPGKGNQGPEILQTFANPDRVESIAYSYYNIAGKLIKVRLERTDEPATLGLFEPE